MPAARGTEQARAFQFRDRKIKGIRILQGFTVMEGRMAALWQAGRFPAQSGEASSLPPVTPALYSGLA